MGHTGEKRCKQRAWQVPSPRGRTKHGAPEGQQRPLWVEPAQSGVGVGWLLNEVREGSRCLMVREGARL